MNTNKMIARKVRYTNNVEQATIELNEIIAQFSHDVNHLAKSLNYNGFISYNAMIKMVEVA